MWYEKNYINKRDWLLDNLRYLNLTSDEIVLLLLIDYCNVNHVMITLDYLKDSMHYSHENVSNIIDQLKQKNYLTIKVVNNSVIYDISNVFQLENPATKVSYDSDLIQLIQNELHKVLTTGEISKIASLKSKVGEERIKYALRQTLLYDKKSIDYLVAVALNQEE